MGKRIFISYKRNTELDQPLAERLFGALREAGHDPFIDQSIAVGEDWARRIQKEVARADFLLLLLSESSVQSGMVVEEVRMANAQFEHSRNQPRILPVRVAFQTRLPYELGGLLNPLNYALWRGVEDDAKLIGELRRAIESEAALPAPELAGGELSPEIPLPGANPRAPLEPPEGTMMPESPFYVTRSADGTIADEQAHPGYTLAIQAPRQMGKSSLLSRVMQRARMEGRSIAFVDFQAFGHAVLHDPDKLYHQFSFLIEDALGLEPELDRHWSVLLSGPSNCGRFMERRILPACGEMGLLLALDEADSLLDAPTSSDFFGMLRSWVNQRANKPAWLKFSLAMVISTEPAMLIPNLSQSPFNVATNVHLRDFGRAEVAQLNTAHGAPLDAAQLEQLYHLLDGHPYLTRKALYLVSKQSCQMAELVQQAGSESGPLGDHLRALLSRLLRCEDLLAALRTALRGGRVENALRHRLIAGGLLKEHDGRLAARNALYAAYFERVL